MPDIFFIMNIFNSISEIKIHISAKKAQNCSIGFVPTMGALHKGHISLIEKACKENSLCVCSIFVNPVQFNNNEDFAKYPRTIDTDITLLNDACCEILFNPSEKEIYPEADNTVFDLGGLDKNMEGAFRKGHFNGVAMVVKKLFEIITPDKAYFGEKDFQQLAIIKYLVKNLGIPVEIISCPTVREADGLAMSSRNQRLSPEERKIAPVIYQTLLKIKEYGISQEVEKLKKWVEKEINFYPAMQLEYFEIVNAETLAPVTFPDSTENPVACIAVNVGKIRLIDNIKFV